MKSICKLNYAKNTKQKILISSWRLGDGAVGNIAAYAHHSSKVFIHGIYFLVDMLAWYALGEMWTPFGNAFSSHLLVALLPSAHMLGHFAFDCTAAIGFSALSSPSFTRTASWLDGGGFFRLSMANCCGFFFGEEWLVEEASVGFSGGTGLNNFVYVVVFSIFFEGEIVE